jgi:hypothetical protein
VSYEGDRQYPTDGKSGNSHPAQEAREAERRLLRAEDAYSEAIQLGFRATNEPPYDFEWVGRVQDNYAARLVRILRKYDLTF